MAYRIYIIMLFALIASSCSKSEPSDTTLGDTNEISFTPRWSDADWGDGTRGVAVDNISTDASIMVYALFDRADATTGCYINHKAAKCKDNIWSFDPSYFYPLNDLDFLAYTPEANDENGVSQSLDIENKKVTFSYNIPTVDRNQPDLLVATPREDCNKTDKVGEMTFNHVLTQITMKAKVFSAATPSNRYYISRFTIHDVTTGATLDYGVESGIGTWESTKTGELITLAMLPDPELGETRTLLTTALQPVFSNGQSLLVIPQPIESREGTKPTIQITISDSESEAVYRTDRITLPSPSGAGWGKGQHIELQFAFDVTKEDVVIPMSFTAKLTDWIIQDVDKEVDKNIYAYFNLKKFPAATPALTLYTNGEVTEIRSTGTITSVNCGIKSGDTYPITITTAGTGEGSITIVMNNSHGSKITKTFNFTVE